jgi:hypothetical protein
MRDTRPSRSQDRTRAAKIVCTRGQYSSLYPFLVILSYATRIGSQWIPLVPFIPNADSARSQLRCGVGPTRGSFVRVVTRKGKGGERGPHGLARLHGRAGAAAAGTSMARDRVVVAAGDLHGPSSSPRRRRHLHGPPLKPSSRWGQDLSRRC